jgi:ABC-type Mn2+/Zn2+ transport system permease subunit
VGGLTADYLVRGTLSVIMGVGWLFAALAAAMGLASPEYLRTSRLGYIITSVSLLLFAACFVYVPGRSVLAAYFPGLI